MNLSPIQRYLIAGIILVSIIGGAIFFITSSPNNKGSNDINSSTGSTETLNSTGTENIEDGTGSKNSFLNEINAKVIEDEKKKSEENQAYTNEFTKIVNAYTQDINANNDVLKYVSTDSITRIKERTRNVYNNFKTDEKKLFLTDLYNAGFDIKGFDIKSEDVLNRYIDFMIKYNIKLQGKITEVSEISGKYDPTSEIFCGTFDYTFDTQKKLKIESLCIDKEKKFLIHSL